MIKVTQGITGLMGTRAPIDSPSWHLDVGSSFPEDAQSFRVGVLTQFDGTRAGFRTM